MLFRSKYIDGLRGGFRPAGAEGGERHRKAGAGSDEDVRHGLAGSGIVDSRIRIAEVPLPKGYVRVSGWESRLDGGAGGEIDRSANAGVGWRKGIGRIQFLHVDGAGELGAPAFVVANSQE